MDTTTVQAGAVNSTQVTDASSDSDATAAFIAEGRPLPFSQSSLSGGCRRLLAAGGLVSVLVLAAVCAHTSSGCETLAGREPGRAAVGAALGLDEEAAGRARAIVSVLNQKSEEEARGLVQKAMKKASSVTQAKRRKPTTFFDVLDLSEGKCSILSVKKDKFLGTDGHSKVTLKEDAKELQEWHIHRVGGDMTFAIEARKAPKGGPSWLAHPFGSRVGLEHKRGQQLWKFTPDNPKAPPKDRVYTIEAVGSGGKAKNPAYLAAKPLGVQLVNLGEGSDNAHKWKVPCLEQASRIQATRKAICAFNVIYAVQYLARAGLSIQGAAKTCPNSRGFVSKVCGLNSLLIVSSFSNLALSISDAASSCAESTNARALCSSSVEALVTSLSNVGAGGIIVATGCNPGVTVDQLGLPPGATPANLGGPSYLTPFSPGRRLFLGGGHRNFMAQCFLDATQVTWSLGSVGLAITQAARDACPGVSLGSMLGSLHQSACAMDIGAVIYAFGRIATYIAIAFIHCTNELNLQAFCAAGVSQLISAAASLVVAGNGLYLACEKRIPQVGRPGGRNQMAIGASVEAGATRRLAAQAAGREKMHLLAESLGYNTSRLPTFDDVGSALEVLEAFDELQAEELGVGRAALQKRFKRAEDMWQHVGINISDERSMPAVPAPRVANVRFVELMERVLSKEDLERVGAATAPQLSQKWQWPLSKSKCL